MEQELRLILVEEHQETQVYFQLLQVQVAEVEVVLIQDLLLDQQEDQEEVEQEDAEQVEQEIRHQ